MVNEIIEDALREHDEEVRRSERKRIARDIWDDEQRCNQAMADVRVGTNAYTYLAGRAVGLQRARDIASDPNLAGSL